MSGQESPYFTPRFPHISPEAFKDNFIDLFNSAKTKKKNGAIKEAYALLLESIQNLEEHLKEDGIISIGHNRRTKYKVSNVSDLETIHKVNPDVAMCQWIMELYATAGEVAAALDIREKSIAYYHECQKWTSYLLESTPNIKRLFSFRVPSNFALEDLANNCINLSRPSQMNDPFDTFAFEWLDRHQAKYPDKKHLMTYKESFKGYFIRSFASQQSPHAQMPYLDRHMWAQYANGHRGFCVEYEFSEDFCQDNMSFEKVQYGDLDFTKDSLTLNEALATKTKEWKSEHEVRLIVYDSNQANDYFKIPLRDKAAITAIYFGLRCPAETKVLIKAALHSNPSIRFYDVVRASDKYPYKLKRRLSEQTTIIPWRQI